MKNVGGRYATNKKFSIFRELFCLRKNKVRAGVAIC